MTLYVVHWMGEKLSLPDLVPLDHEERRAPTYQLDISAEELGAKLTDLAQQFDLMLLTREGQFWLWLDNKGRKFRTR